MHYYYYVTIIIIIIIIIIFVTIIIVIITIIIFIIIIITTPNSSTSGHPMDSAWPERGQASEGWDHRLVRSTDSQQLIFIFYRISCCDM